MIEFYAGQHAEVAAVFHEAVRRTAAAAYTPEQLAAWSPDPPNLGRWRARCELKRPWLAVVGGRVAGFLELDHVRGEDRDDPGVGRIDCHYVHPDFGRRGVGTALLRHAVEVATAFGLARLTVEASRVAAPLYRREGFVLLDDAPNAVRLRGQTLENWRMGRTLAAAHTRPDPPPTR